MKRRAFLGLGATSVGVGALYGTGAFSSVNAGRGVSINAADDSSAIVTLDIADSVETQNDVERLYTITNKLNDELAVETSIDIDEEDEGDIFVVNPDITVQSGDSEDVEVEFTENNVETEEITFEIDATTDSGVSVILNRGPVMVLGPGDSMPVLSIDDVRGLDDESPDHDFTAEVDVSEEDGTETEDLEVTLSIEDSDGDTAYSESSFPDDISNEQVTVEFDDIGELDEDEYDYVASAEAENASEVTFSGEFVVTSGDKPPSLSVENASRGDANSEIEFDLRNDGEQIAIIRQISVDNVETNKNINSIEREQGDEFERTDGDGSLNQILHIPSNPIDLDQNAELDPDDDGEFRLGLFREEEESTINMNNRPVDITLYLDGAPDQALTLDV